MSHFFTKDSHHHGFLTGFENLPVAAPGVEKYDEEYYFSESSDKNKVSHK